MIGGNIGAVYFGLHARANQIESEVRRQVEAGLKAKGFIVSIGSPFPLETPLKNVDVLVSAAHSLRLRKS
jgi:uroporphyrinogen-III decarboxylase